MTGSFAKSNVFREIERFAPIDNFAVSVVRVFGAERGPADETLEHDGADGPPVAAEGVAFTGEDFGSDVVRCSDCRVGHDATGFAPGVDLAAVADSEVDLIEVYGGAVVSRFRG